MSLHQLHHIVMNKVAIAVQAPPPPLTDAADTESDDTENGEWKMTPQSKFVKDECCRLIRKGVCIPALARDEEIQGVHHRGHPRVVGRRQS
jgi:hypothetical protein